MHPAPFYGLYFDNGMPHLVLRLRHREKYTSIWPVFGPERPKLISCLKHLNWIPGMNGCLVLWVFCKHTVCFAHTQYTHIREVELLWMSSITVVDVLDYWWMSSITHWVLWMSSITTVLITDRPGGWNMTGLRQTPMGQFYLLGTNTGCHNVELRVCNQVCSICYQH